MEYQTITELAPRIQRGELSPLTLTEQLLARIEALNPKLNAMRLICRERALAAAEAAERQIRAGQYLGPLHGIPYLTKDIFDVAGLVTTAGSKTLADNVVAEDAVVTRKLAQAGMILLGKTNTVEFAFGSVGINHNHGTPYNPWHSEHHIPGGSSSGSAVAVASGLAPLAMGSDTACSVRGPAALCGVVGLKTTVGRISRHGVYPLSWTLDSVGPLTRSVPDAALVLEALQGPDRADPATLSLDPVDALTSLDDGVEGLRMAFPESQLMADLDPDVETAVRACGPLFESLGVQVQSLDFAVADAALALPAAPSMIEGCVNNAEHLDQQLDKIDPVVSKRMMLGREVGAIDYAKTLAEMHKLRAQCGEFWQRTNIDALLLPTTMHPALPLATIDADIDTYLGYAFRYMRNCYVGNLLDFSAVSVPCGFTAQGLPIGLMIYTLPGREDLALRIAQAYQQNTDWHSRRPPEAANLR